MVACKGKLIQGKYKVHVEAPLGKLATEARRQANNVNKWADPKAGLTLGT